MDALDSPSTERLALVPRWVAGATKGLALVAALYLAEGLYRALFGVMPQDLARRWLEGAYVVRHINPLDVFAGLHAPDPELGPAHAGGYPPWSTVLGLLVAPPIRQGWLRVYFATLNLVALGVIARHAFRAGAPYGPAVARLLVVSCLAVSANDVVLRHGQYGILVNAALVLMLDAFQTKQRARGGFWLAAAALKPQTSVPFAFLWLRRRGMPALGVTAGLVAGGTLGLSFWIHASPLHVFSQVFGQAANWDGGDAGPLRLLLALGVPRGFAIPALALVSMVTALALLHRFRDAAPGVQAAIACVAGRLWTYHRRYDDVMLIFLLVPLALAALERGGRRAWLPFLAVGLSVWLPLREIDHGVVLITLKVTTWIAALVWLLREPLPEKRAVLPFG